MGKVDIAAAHIAPDIVGTAVDYPGLRKLIAERRKELGLSQIAVDEIAGLAGGYTGKVECGMRCFGDMSLAAMFGALDMSLAVVRGAGAHAKNCEISEASICRRVLHRKKASSKGGYASALNRTPEERRASARHAAKKRWRDWRAVKAEKERKLKRTKGK